MNQTNYQRTAAWLKACGKKPHDSQNLSTAIGVHLEEMAEQIELIKVDNEACSEALDTAFVALKNAASMIKSAHTLATIPQPLRTDFLKELCDGKVTADGVAYMMGADMDEADKRVIDANWSKFDENGQALFDEGGKIKKSKMYKKADLKGLV